MKKWPPYRGPTRVNGGGGFPLRPKPVPVVGRSNTIKSIGLTYLKPLPAQPGVPGAPPFLLGLLMVRSDGIPVDIDVPVPQSGTALDYVNIISQGLEHLQTYLNCHCRPGTPDAPGELCALHKPKTDAPPSQTGIILTDKP